MKNRSFTVQAVLQRFHSTPFPLRTLSPMLLTPRSISISCLVEQIFVAASRLTEIAPKEPIHPFVNHLLSTKSIGPGPAPAQP